jgi:N-acyl-D-amino-acid deacylase
MTQFVNKKVSFLSGICVALLLFSVSSRAQRLAPPYDTILKGGIVFDGTGAASVRTDVAIRDGLIAKIGDLSDETAENILDISGMTLTPGFIDLHSHADSADEPGGLRSRNSHRRAAPNLVTQGITTVVVNQDGRSPIDIARQHEYILSQGIGLNTVLMVGHNTIRRAAMQSADSYRRPVTPEELERMKELLKDGLEAGAYGMTAGLEYEPGIWSTTDELTELVREIVPYNGIYIVHERSSGLDPMWVLPSQDSSIQPTMLESIEETIEISEATGVTSVATHIKARGRLYWGKSKPIIDAIQKARDRGVKIYADQYPYTTSGSDGTIVLIPYWVMDRYKGESTNYRGGLIAALQNPQWAEDLYEDVDHMINRRGGAERIIVINHPNRSFIGKSLHELARQREIPPVHMVYLLQLEGYRSRYGGAILRGFSLNRNDVDAFAKQPWVATASDAGITLREDGLVHARYYGTYPRKIKDMVLDRKIIPMEKAIHSMTGLPAEILGFSNRGLIKEGYVADLTVLNLNEIRDRSTFFQPHQYADGVPHVLVNGEFVVEDYVLTFELPGQIITPKSAHKMAHTDD